MDIFNLNFTDINVLNSDSFTAGTNAEFGFVVKYLLKDDRKQQLHICSIYELLAIK